MKRIRRLWVPVASVIAYLLVRLFQVSWRIRWDNEPHIQEVMRRWGGAYLACVWHENCLATLFSHVKIEGGCMASRSNAGEVMTFVIRRYGWHAIRGSQKGGGKDAREETLAVLDKGLPVALTVDGSSGPRRVCKPGIIDMASKGQWPIIPTVAVADRYWILRNTWDEMRIPKPFARIYLRYGEGMMAPEDLDGDEFRAFQAQVGLALSELEEKLLDDLGWPRQILSPPIEEKSASKAPGIANRIDAR